MFTFLKNIFSKERVNKETIQAVEDFIGKTRTSSLRKTKLKSLTELNDQLSVATDEMKKVSSELINKLNNEIEGLTTHLKVISETTSEGIMTLDYRGIIINVNHSVEQMFGYNFKELIGKDISKILPINLDACDLKTYNFSDVMESVSHNIFSNLKFKGGSFNIDKYFSLSKHNKKIVGKTKDKKNIFLEINVNIINPNVSSFEKIQYICIMNDITELTTSKKEIQNLSKFQFSLVEAIPNSIYWKDKNFRYVGCNSEFERITGFKREEIVGKTIQELCDIAEKNKGGFSDFDNEEKLKLIKGEDHIKDLIEKAQREKTPLSEIKRLPTRNKAYNKNTGEYKDVVIYRTIFINDDGEFDGLVCSMMDVTKLLSDGIL